MVHTSRTSPCYYPLCCNDMGVCLVSTMGVGRAVDMTVEVDFHSLWQQVVVESGSRCPLMGSWVQVSNIMSNPRAYDFVPCIIVNLVYSVTSHFLLLHIPRDVKDILEVRGGPTPPLWSGMRCKTCVEF